MNSREDIFVEIKNKKVFRFNLDTKMTQELMARIFSLEEKEFLFFYDDINFFLAFVETITPNDIDNELKSTLTAQRKEFFKKKFTAKFYKQLSKLYKAEC